MCKKMLFGLFVCVGVVFGGELTFASGKISTHTEILGDKEIDNISNEISSKITKDESSQSIKGEISLAVETLVSKKADRDEHLYETLESKKFPNITFVFKEVKHLHDDNYTIIGLLNIHGVEREIESNATISQKEMLNISGNLSLLISDYGMEPPSLLFLTVRDQVDINYDLHFK